MNNVAGILKLIGIGIIVIGIIGGIAFWQDQFGFLPGILTIAYSVVSGVLFIGFSEVIRLLESINSKLDNVEDGIVQPKNKPNNKIVKNKDSQSNVTAVKWTLDKMDEDRIVEFYENKNKKVYEIIQSPFEDICLVKYSNGIHLVETGGFSPKILNGSEIHSTIGLEEWIQEQTDN